MTKPEIIERMSDVAFDIIKHGDEKHQKWLREHVQIAMQAALDASGLWPDTLRLNFLDRCNQNLNAHYGTTYGWKFDINHNRVCLRPDGHTWRDLDLHDTGAGIEAKTSVRAAIDKAMQPLTPAPEDK